MLREIIDVGNFVAKFRQEEMGKGGGTDHSSFGKHERDVLVN